MTTDYHPDIHTLSNYKMLQNGCKHGYMGEQGYMGESPDPEQNKLVTKYNKLVSSKNNFIREIVDKINYHKCIDWEKYNSQYVEIINAMEDISLKLKLESSKIEIHCIS